MLTVKRIDLVKPTGVHGHPRLEVEMSSGITDAVELREGMTVQAISRHLNHFARRLEERDAMNKKKQEKVNGN